MSAHAAFSHPENEDSPMARALGQRYNAHPLKHRYAAQAGSTGFNEPSPAATEKRSGRTTMSHEKYKDCIEACHQCMEACEHCATACLHEDDVKMMARCIELDRSCADICSLAMREMSRGSQFAAQVCELCADVCDACGEECGKHQADHCQVCAKACRECAEACREMASSASAGKGATDRPLKR
jgi:hypothetical protein